MLLVTASPVVVLAEVDGSMMCGGGPDDGGQDVCQVINSLEYGPAGLLVRVALLLDLLPPAHDLLIACHYLVAGVDHLR